MTGELTAEFGAGMFVGVGLGVLLGLAFTLTYTMKQLRKIESWRNPPTMWSTSTLTKTFTHANDDDMEDLRPVTPFDPEMI